MQSPHTGIRMCLPLFAATIGTMTTPAERASAVAFAQQSCALESLTPSSAVIAAAGRYERGDLSTDRLLSEGSAESVADKILVRTILLIERGWPFSGDLQELRAIHQGLFTGVYDDAGTLRTGDTTKGKNARSSNPEAFFPAGLIETGAANISRELAEKRNLKCLDRATSSTPWHTSTMSSVICIPSWEATRWSCAYSPRVSPMMPDGIWIGAQSMQPHTKTPSTAHTTGIPRHSSASSAPSSDRPIRPAAS